MKLTVRELKAKHCLNIISAWQDEVGTSGSSVQTAHQASARRIQDDQDRGFLCLQNDWSALFLSPVQEAHPSNANSPLHPHFSNCYKKPDGQVKTLLGLSVTASLPGTYESSGTKKRHNHLPACLVFFYQPLCNSEN